MVNNKNDTIMNGINVMIDGVQDDREFNKPLVQALKICNYIFSKSVSKQ